MTTDTVEWGSEHGRPSGMPRWAALAAPRRHATAIAGGLAILGFALTLTAELLPWLEVTPPATAPAQVNLPDQIDTSVRLTQLVVWQAPAYYVGVTALLVFTALALFGRARAQRGAAAAGLGTAAGQAVLLTGLYATIQEREDIAGMLARIPEGVADFATGDGFYSAVVGLVLLAASVGLAGWWGGARPATAPPAAGEADTGEPVAAGPDESADKPLDLAVAPAAPFHDRA